MTQPTLWFTSHEQNHVHSLFFQVYLKSFMCSAKTQHYHRQGVCQLPCPVLAPLGMLVNQKKYAAYLPLHLEVGVSEERFGQEDDEL